MGRRSKQGPRRKPERGDRRPRRGPASESRRDAGGRRAPGGSEAPARVDFVVNRDLLYEHPKNDFNVLCGRFAYERGFPVAAQAQADAFKKDPSWDLAEGRLDLSREWIITIDGETAKDFDDAISIEYRDGVWHLGVHIADVSFFVGKESKLDLAARRRGTSVYLIDHVIPMLPEVLSNDLCSLVEGQRRLTFSCLITLDDAGRRTGFQFRKSVIVNRRRSTYHEVQAVLDGKLDLGPEFAEKAALMNRLKEILFKKRMAEGAMNLESTELEFEPGRHGAIESISPRPRIEAERVIEEFMLQANICAALLMEKHGAGVYRVHEPPDPEKLMRFGQLAKARGLEARGLLDPHPVSKNTPNPLNAILAPIADPEERRLFSFLLLTSFMQARYSEANVGHWGLGFTHYSHFTSPIRRYPDLLVHRILTAIVHKAKAPHRPDEIEKMAADASQLERKAVTAEREYHKIKTIRYLEPRIGEFFQTLVLGIIPRGLFVRDLATGIEGFVDYDWLARLADEELFFDERDQSFKTAKGKQVWFLGKRVEVELVGLNPERLFIDFKPVEDSPSRI